MQLCYFASDGILDTSADFWPVVRALCQNGTSGFLREAPGLQAGKPGVKAQAFRGSRKEGYFMTLVLLGLLLVLVTGGLKVTIVWTRKGRR